MNRHHMNDEDLGKLRFMKYEASPNLLEALEPAGLHFDVDEPAGTVAVLINDIYDLMRLAGVLASAKML